MKFLCLPGGYNNAKTLDAQLQPLCENLRSDNSASFIFTQGAFPCTPPDGFEDFFGPPPHYRFMTPGVADDVFKLLRGLHREASADATIKNLIESSNAQDISLEVRVALERISDIIDKEGNIEGIIGYSEGASMAATYLLEEQRKLQEHGVTPKIKLAVFFSGWPPFDPMTGKVQLRQDTKRPVIDIPTCHVVGTVDPFIDGCMALYNLCEPDEADLFDHGAGHIIPRDSRTLKELADVVRDMVQTCSERD